MCWYNKQVFNKRNAFNVQCRFFSQIKTAFNLWLHAREASKNMKAWKVYVQLFPCHLLVQGTHLVLQVCGTYTLSHTHTNTHSCIIIYLVVDSDLQQARCGIRRRFFDLFMVCLFWQSPVTARDAACYSELVESRSNNKIHLVYKNRNRIHILPKTLRSEEMKEKQLI